MADYKSCAWYQNGMCIRDDKSGAPISCTDCEDYERRVVYKIEDTPENRALADKVKADMVNNPAHYTSGGIECIDCIKAALGENFIGFLIGNVIKYSYRYKDKNGVNDLEKASVYLKWAIEEMKKNETT